MIVPYTGSIIPFDRRPCPDPGHSTNSIAAGPGLVEGYEKRSTLGPENSAVQHLRDQSGEIIVAGGNRAIVHVITDVRVSHMKLEAVTVELRSVTNWLSGRPECPGFAETISKHRVALF